MPAYNGHILYLKRVDMKRPIWANQYIRRMKFPSRRDMVAMINYCLKKRGLSKRVALRSYERWEQKTYPEWFRVAAFWIYNDIERLCRSRSDYKIMLNGKYSGHHQLEPVLSLQAKLKRINIERDYFANENEYH